MSSIAARAAPEPPVTVPLERLVADARPDASLGLSLPSLPPEIWMMIILNLDDHCFAWFVLRRVSTFLRHVTERVVAQRIIKDVAIRFAGAYAKDVIVEHLIDEDLGLSESENELRREHLNNLFSTQNPTFLFEATRFSPPDTKERVVLKLKEPVEPYTNSHIKISMQLNHLARSRKCGLPAHVQGKCCGGTLTLPLPFYLRHRCCSCTPQIESVEDLARCNCLEDIFFAQSAKQLGNLAASSHFVRIGKELKNLRLGHVELDKDAREISLDWRLLCHRAYHDELLLRRSIKPWPKAVPLVHGAFPHYANHNAVVSDAEDPQDRWIFWDFQQPTLDPTG